MIISRTPFRVSFFGGGTDYPDWFRQHGGAVLGTSIDKYCYISLRYLPPFFEHKHRIVYSLIENVRALDEIQHPAVRCVMQECGVERGLEIHHDGDLPARSGLGSSSSFTVGLLNALHALKGRLCDAGELAREAIRIEQNIIKEDVGSQDQIWAAYGGTNYIAFHKDGGFDVKPVKLTDEQRGEWESHFMLFFTGLSRVAATIAKKQISNLANKETELRRIREYVDEGHALLLSPETGLSDFGRLLSDSWKYKRSLADGVSTPEIDEIFDAALSAGAIGGKLLGAGGGGFVLLFARPEAQQKIRERLSHLVEVRFSMKSTGSKIVINEPQGLGEV